MGFFVHPHHPCVCQLEEGRCLNLLCIAFKHQKGLPYPSQVSFSAHNLSHLTPEVHEASDVGDGVRDGDEDEDAAQEVEEQEEGRDQDAEEGQADVAVKLLGYHLDGKVRFWIKNPYKSLKSKS